MTPSNDRQLSNTLVRLNLVTQRQIDQAIALQATDHPDMSLTDILVKYRMVDATDVESARSGLPHAAEAGEDPLIGRVVGGCHIEREIGRGGMGVVYLARDRSLSHNVAIKILPAELTRDPTYLNRFRKEAQAVGRLDHPHIVALYQVGVESGTHFIAMQYANGGSVADWLRSEGTLPKTDATRIFDELLQALGAAHDSGIIHRDIKPENILLTKKGSSLLADFGVARDMSSVTVLTTTVGSVLGSPYYMAPELWDGRRATAQSDLFAAGVTFYYMLTGGVPFWGSSPMVVLKALVTAEPDLAQITDPALRSLISWLLQKKAKDRPPNAQAVRDVLAGRAVPPVIPDDQLLTQPVPIQHRPSERRAQTKDRARRWIGTFLLVLGVLVVGGIALLELSKDTPTLTSTPTPIPTRLKIAIGELKKGNIGLKWPPNRSSNPKYNRGWWEKEEVTLVVALPVPGSLRYFEGESPKLILRAKQTKAVVKDGKLQITLPAHELVKEDGASKEVTLSFETDKGDSFLDELCEIKDGFPVRGRFDFRPLEIKKAELIILPKQGALYQMKVLITVDAKDGIKNPSVRQTVGVWSETETICTFILSIDLDTLKGLWKGLEDFTIEDKFGNESARISPKDWTLGVDRNSTAEAEYKDTIKGIVEKWYIATGQEDHGKKSDELIGSLRKEKEQGPPPITAASASLDTTKTVARVKYLLLVDDQGEPKKFKGRYYWMSTQELSCGAVKRLEGGEELVKVMLDSIKEHTEENINCTTRPKFPYVCAATDVKVILRFMKDQHNVEFELPTRAMWECANKMRPKSKKHHQRAKVTNKGHNNRSASFKELKDVDEYSIADPSTFGFLWGNVSEWVLDGGSRRPYGLSIGDKMQLSPDEGSAGMTGIRLVFWEKIPK